jgi:hypothetical protein
VHLDIPLATSQRERICFGHNFKFSNWTEIKDFLNSVDFYHLFNNAQSPAAAFESFYDVIYTCIELLCPVSALQLLAGHSTLNTHTMYKDLREKRLLLGVFFGLSELKNH